MTQFSSTEHANNSYRKSLNEYRDDLLKIKDIQKRNDSGEKVTVDEIQWLCYKLTYRTSQVESSLYDH